MASTANTSRSTAWGVIISILGIGATLLLVVVGITTLILLPLQNSVNTLDNNVDDIRIELSNVERRLSEKIDGVLSDLHDTEVALVERITRLESAQSSGTP